jgi:hypothetical protein
MSKNSSNSLKSLQLAEEDWMDYPAVQWLIANKQKILYGALALFILILLTYRWMSHRALDAENDYFQAQTDFSLLHEQVMQGKGINADSLKKLEAIMKRHPELQAKYDASLAQLLIIGQSPAEAASFAQTTLDRTKNPSLDFYHSYAQTTLLVSNQQYEAAYAQAQELKNKMNESSEPLFGNTLYAFNLIRLAFLEQVLGQYQAELQTWEELRHYYQNREGTQTISQLFKDGAASLSGYMEERIKTLSQ